MNRYVVNDAYYSAPENVSDTERYYEVPCEMNRFCVNGVAALCGKPQCWPMPLSFVAREAVVGEFGSDGTDYFLAKAPGLGVGDVIEIQFDTNSTMPDLSYTAAVIRLLEFNCPFGQDGYELSGTWVTPSLLKVTVTQGYWSTAGVTDSLRTRIGTIAVRLRTAGDVRYVGAVLLLMILIDTALQCLLHGDARFVAATLQTRGQHHAANLHRCLCPVDGHVGTIRGTPADQRQSYGWSTARRESIPFTVLLLSLRSGDS